MADLCSGTEGEFEFYPDFTAGPFVTRREPVRELITTFSGLYIDSDRELEAESDNCEADDDDINFPLPPPPPETEINDQDMVENLRRRVVSLEEQLTNCMQKVSEGVTSDQLECRCRAGEDKLFYHVERACERVKVWASRWIALLDVMSRWTGRSTLAYPQHLLQCI